MFLKQLFRHVASAVVGVAANFFQAKVGVPLDAGAQSGLVVAVYAVMEKILKKVWPASISD